MLGDLLHVFCIFANGKQTTGNTRVEGLYAAIKNLRKPGQIGHLAQLDAIRAEKARSTAGGNNLNAEIGQRAREFHNSGFVINANQRSFDSSHVSSGISS